MKYLLIVGKNGQLGKSIGGVLEELKRFDKFCIKFVGKNEFDLLNPNDGYKAIDNRYMNGIVMNVAALTKVDCCEIFESTAFGINALGVLMLAQKIALNEGTLVQISTDYVFPGTYPTPLKETDPVCPINAYGRTKWEGEVFVRAICPKHFIVRTAWLYGLHGKNFVKTILKKARETGRLSVVADQYGSPTYANDLAEALLQLAQTDRYGTYHCTNAGVCSWFELASAAVDIAGIPCEKEAITTEEYRRRFPQSARRPMYSALDNTKIAGVLGKPLRPWREALEEFIDALQKEEAQDAEN